MATGTAALAQKLVSRKSTTSLKPKNSAKSRSSSSAAKVTKTRSDVPWQKIADLYNKGMSVSEISDKLNLTRPKTKDGKHENPYPYYLTVGYLTKLSHGVEVEGTKISIVRGAKNKKRSESKDK
jgi:hypothetical protein